MTSPADDDMADAVCLVTGAARGLGSVIAAHLFAAGGRVVLAARDLERAKAMAAEFDPAGHRTAVVAADTCDEASLLAAADVAHAAFGRLDTVVCNSGIAGPTANAWEGTADDWRATIEVNLIGTYLTCRAVLPSLIAQQSGSIVVIGSMTGKRALPGRSSYMASKTALIGLVRSLAHDVGPHGVRVNLVSPGAIEGPRIDAVFAAQAQARAITPQQARHEMTADAPLGRLVTNDEVARVVRFLASDASSGITGEDMNVSAGLVTY